MPRVLLTAAARADLDDALAWYEQHAPSVVPRFRSALRDTVARIGKNPKQFPASALQMRQALLHRFPHLVIFREARGAVYVVAIFHTSRDPKIWRLRSG